MKTPEDEAFDDLAKRQGHWGGGYRAKREAALDKILQEQLRLGVYGSVPQPAQSTFDTHAAPGKALDTHSRAPQPAQEPVAWRFKTGTWWNREVHWRYVLSLNGTEGLLGLEPLYTTPPQRPWVGLTNDERKALERFTDTCDDGEGYDVPKQMMQRLAQIGVVNHTSGGIYSTTEFGRWVIDAAPPQRERVVFPTMLRKMWSGGEVQAWLDENVNKEKNNG